MKYFSQSDFRNVHANQASPTACISVKTLCQMGAVGNQSLGLLQAWLVLQPQFGLCLYPPGSVLASCTTWQPQPILTHMLVLLEAAAARATGARAEPGQLHLQKLKPVVLRGGLQSSALIFRRPCMRGPCWKAKLAQRAHTRLLCGNVTVSLADGVPLGAGRPLAAVVMHEMVVCEPPC